MISNTHRIARGLCMALLLTPTLHQASALESIRVGTSTRNMIVYAPAGLPAKRPLLISMHGYNQDAGYQQSQANYEQVADTAKFLVVYPDGIDRAWDISGNRDIDFVLAIIDTMANRYDIDRNRVYLSGFSMGGMFTYHAISRIADKIAAFAPVSGTGGTPSASRPVPIIHIHGDDDNYANVPNYMKSWARFNNCPETSVFTKPYPVNKPQSPSSKTYWGPGDNGVEVVLLTLGGKGHWHSNDPVGVMSNEEIWNFCKRFSLDLSEPTVRFLKPSGEANFVVFGAEPTTAVEAITFEVSAFDPDGTIDSVVYYNGDTKLYTSTTAPYTFRWDNVAAGNHQIRAVAFDNEGKTGSATLSVNVVVPTSGHDFTQSFSSAGIVPAGWTTYDGTETRIGFQAGLSSGCRVFQLTGTPRDFNYGLYVRNTSGAPKAGYAKLGDPSGTTTILVHPGVYALSVTSANWNMAGGGTVTCQVRSVSGDSLLTSLWFKPTSNIGNSMSNGFSGSTAQTLWFEVTQPQRVALEFYTQDLPWADFVLGKLILGPQPDNALNRCRAGLSKTFGAAQSALSAASDLMYAGASYDALSALVSEYTRWQSNDTAAYTMAIERLMTATNDLLTHKAAIDATETEQVVFASNFSGLAGTVPAGWETFDGTTRRKGLESGLGQGCRVLHFTGTPRNFDDALYIRNIDGRANEGYAKYASAYTDSILELKKGKYRLSYRVCNWNMSGFGAIRGRLVNRSTGAAIVENTVTPTCNIGNNPSNAFSGSTLVELSFQIDTDQPGSLEFYTTDAGWADAIIADISLRRVVYSDLSSLTPEKVARPVNTAYYDLRGMPLKGPVKGLYLVRTTYADGRTQVEKVLMH